MSGKVVPGRNTAAAEGDVVVFHIGLRINRLRAFSSWFPAFMSMPRMLRELSQEKSSGLLGYKVLYGSVRDFLRRPVLVRQGAAPRLRPPAGQGAPARMGGVQPTSTRRKGSCGHLARDVHRPGRLLRIGVRRHARLRPRRRDRCRTGRPARRHGGPASECRREVGVRTVGGGCAVRAHRPVTWASAAEAPESAAQTPSRTGSRIATHST